MRPNTSFLAVPVHESLNTNLRVKTSMSLSHKSTTPMINPNGRSFQASPLRLNIAHTDLKASLLSKESSLLSPSVRNRGYKTEVNHNEAADFRPLENGSL